MSEIILTDKSFVPDDALLMATLDPVFPGFKKIEALTDSFTREWKFYNAKSGWSYKIADKKKALCYITPLQNSFNFSMAIRESEKDALLKSQLPDEIRDKLETADKFPEGFALRLNIKSESNLNQIMAILNLVIGMRK